MKKHVWLEFENDEKMNAFMKQILGRWPGHTSSTESSSIGFTFSKKHIEIALKDYGAKIMDRPSTEKD